MASSAQNLPILTVSQLTNAIKHCLETTFPHIWLQGEISNFKPHSSGHLYFTLKDPFAQISAIMFRSEAAALRFPLKDGAQVLVRGELNVYPAQGKYQIVVRELRPVGLGDLLLKFEELKNKLAQKGWFDPARKKPLPKLPKRIGVVTSPTGAAIQDILNVLARRFSGFHLIINPVRVQGEGAAFEIAAAIRQFNQYGLADVLIVGRGGGSIEDLWAFNEEAVADAIYHSRIPVISAVGHETDNCISDFVADVRAPTPSAAAAMVIAEKQLLLDALMQKRRRLQQTVLHLIRQYKHRLDGITKQPVLSSPYGLLGSWMQRMDDFRCDLDAVISQYFSRKKLMMAGMQKHLHALKPTTQILQFRHKILHWDKSLRNAMNVKMTSLKTSVKDREAHLVHAWTAKQQIRRKLFAGPVRRRQIEQLWERILSTRRERLEKLEANLKSIDPKNLLKKGYSILFSEKDHSVINSVRSVEENQNVRVKLADGEILTTVNKIFDFSTFPPAAADTQQN